MASSSWVRKSLTLEEYLKIPEQKPVLEYIDGRIEAKVSPPTKHSVMTKWMAVRLDQYAGPAGLGEAFPELRCTFDGRSIVPDVAFLRVEHIAFDERGEYLDVIRIPSDIHVEIISPTQSVRTSREKLAHSTTHGCPLGWLIHPDKGWIEVYRAGQAPQRLASEDALDGAAVLPGFLLPVTEVIGWLQGRRHGPNVPAEPGAGPA